jgi:hypothetical protein
LDEVYVNSVILGRELHPFEISLRISEYLLKQSEDPTTKPESLDIISQIMYHLTSEDIVFVHTTQAASSMGEMREFVGQNQNENGSHLVQVPNWSRAKMAYI